MRRAHLALWPVLVVAAGAALAVAWPLWPPPAGADDPRQLALGEQVYSEHCASCHGAGLEGEPEWETRRPDGCMPAPPHDDSGHTWHHDDDMLFGIVKQGLEPFVAPGYASDMPAFEGVLSDAEIRAVLAFIKSHWGPRERAFQEDVTRGEAMTPIRASRGDSACLSRSTRCTEMQLDPFSYLQLWGDALSFGQSLCQHRHEPTQRAALPSLDKPGMISAQQVLGVAKERGFDFFTGVPCSFLTPFINGVIGDRATDYIGAANEGDAVAIAAGAWLGGRGTVVMLQNSGLGNAINPLTSLNWPFRIPTLLVITWRGQPGLGDEPQHELMGARLKDLLRACDLEHEDFPSDAAELACAFDRARETMTARCLPYALVLRKGTIIEEALDEPALEPREPGRHLDLRRSAERPTRFAALEVFLAAAPDAAAVIATTGECGRELFTLAERPQHLYQVGSMGCASAMGLGVALTTGRQVAVLDGDGAALMRLGNLATIGAHAPPGLVHVILDNGVHDSTGGQATVSPLVDFPRIALACGYASGTACDDLQGLEQALRAAFATPGPHLVHLRIRPGSIRNLGRPTVKPPEVARRFRSFLATVD